MAHGTKGQAVFLLQEAVGGINLVIQVPRPGPQKRKTLKGKSSSCGGFVINETLRTGSQRHRDSLEHEPELFMGSEP